MSHQDKFPPNVFIKKHTKQGYIFTILLFILAMACPSSIAQPVFIILMLLFTTGSCGLLIWQVVWVIRNPPPPPQYCPTCHQILPDNNKGQNGGS